MNLWPLGWCGLVFALSTGWTKDKAKGVYVERFFSSFPTQNLILQHKDFDAAFAPLQKKLFAIKAKLDLENEPQPNLLGKKTQLQRLQVHYNNAWP